MSWVDRFNLGVILPVSSFLTPNTFRSAPVTSSTPSGVLFLEDFLGTSLSANWSVVRGAAQFSVSGGFCTLTGTGNGTTCPEASPTALVPKVAKGMYYEAKVKLGTSTQSGSYVGFGDGTYDYRFVYTWDHSGGTTLYALANGVWTSMGTGWESAQHIYRIEADNTSIRFYIDGVLKHTVNGGGLGSATIYNMYVYENGNQSVFDYIKIGYL